MASTRHQITLEERYRRVIGGDALIIASIIKAISDKYGEEGLCAIRQELFNVTCGAMAHLAKLLGARIGDGDIRDLVNIGRFTEQMHGIETEYIVESSKKCVIQVKSCIAAAQYKRIFPGSCAIICPPTEEAIASVVNPNIRVYSTGKYLTRGDESCEFICELKD